MIKFITSLPYPDITLERGTLDEVRLWAQDKRSISADTETTGLHPLLYKLLLLIVGDENVQYVIDLRSTSRSEVISLLMDLKDKKWIFHNSKFDYSFIKAHYGVELRNLYCTFLASQIIMNGRDFDHSLKALVWKTVGFHLNKQTRNSFINKPDHEPFTQAEIEYAGSDISHLKSIAQLQMRYIKEREQELLIKVENQVTPVIANMELRGIDLDIPKWRYIAENNITRAYKIELLMDRDLKRLSKQFEGLRGGMYTRKRIKAEVEQLDMFGAPAEVSQNHNTGNVNYASSKQVHGIFSRCGQTIPGVNEDDLLVFLKTYPQTELKPFIEHLLYYKKIKKRISTYGDSFLEFINPVTGRIHTNFTQCFTDTGRFSSGDSRDDDNKKLHWFVNFQNIPKLKDYRQCFTVPNVDYDYITLDLSGAEIVIAASNSQDPLLIKSITEKLDLHSMLASKSYSIIHKMTGRKYNVITQVDPDGNITITKKDEELRDMHKPVLFGIMYMAGANRISELLDIPLEVAEEVLQGIFELLPMMKNYLHSTAKQALKKGFIISNNVTKRRRYFPMKHRVEKPWKVEKEACNFPIQGTNADMIKMALVEIDKHIADNNLDAWIVNTVHDEISVIAHSSISQQVFKDVKRIMEETANLFLTNVKMSSSGGIGKSWTK